MDNQLYMSSSPHVHSGETTQDIMRAVIYALLPACVLSIYYFGLEALLVLLLCTAGCLTTEAVCCVLSKRAMTLSDGSAAITGILLALNLPASSPWWLALFGSIIAVTIGKQVFGGLGHNPFNPALVARVVLLISFPVQMTSWTSPTPLGHGLDALTAATPLGEMKTSVMLTGQLPASAHSGFSDYLIGNMAGSIGEVSALAVLLGGLYLLKKKVITWEIPASYLGSVILFGGMFWLIDSQRYPDPLFHLLTGGLLLGAFFMATDMVTTPITRSGMLIFGVGCGVITVLIRLFGGYPEGVSFAILLMNGATPLIDRYTRPKVFGRNPYHNINQTPAQEN
ncbi:MAG: RnfABCDGE type electron transport complex subunit D [Desulfuromonas sp.]|nr:RnfABCDGE type electron transport complex subunit D [Desulfuromonas sp.]